MKTLLWILTVLFFLLSWWWYVCPHKQVCPFGDYAAVARKVPELERGHRPDTSGSELRLDLMDPADVITYDQGEIYFNWSDDEPFVTDGFANVRDSILSSLSETDLLKITGHYYEAEENHSLFPDLGYARANKMKLLFRDLASDRFQLESEQRTIADQSQQGAPHPAITLRRLIRNGSIVESDGRVIIKFPHASDEMINNNEVNAYLDDLVQQLKGTEEYVYIVGHTDNTASSRRNLSLGWKRANAIRNLILSKGLPDHRVISESAGESSPIASNETEEGRSQNRRVEVTILDDLN